MRSAAQNVFGVSAPLFDTARAGNDDVASCHPGFSVESEVPDNLAR
jgi:hypothetical protein